MASNISTNRVENKVCSSKADFLRHMVNLAISDNQIVLKVVRFRSLKSLVLASVKNQKGEAQLRFKSLHTFWILRIVDKANIFGLIIPNIKKNVATNCFHMGNCWF